MKTRRVTYRILLEFYQDVDERIILDPTIEDVEDFSAEVTGKTFEVKGLRLVSQESDMDNFRPTLKNDNKPTNRSLN